MTPEQIAQWAREAGFEHIAEADYWHPMFAQFAAKVAAHEREMCAQVANGAIGATRREIAELIRARGA